MLSLTLYQLAACASGRPFKRSVLQLTIRLRARGLHEAVVDEGEDRDTNQNQT